MPIQRRGEVFYARMMYSARITSVPIVPFVKDNILSVMINTFLRVASMRVDRSNERSFATR